MLILFIGRHPLHFSRMDDDDEHRDQVGESISCYISVYINTCKKKNKNTKCIVLPEGS